MTCILGYEGDGVAYMAADSRSTVFRADIMSDNERKIVACGRWRVACAGPARLRLLMVEMAEEFAVCVSIGQFACAIKAAIAKEEWKPDEEVGPRGHGYDVLAMADGALWWLGSGSAYVRATEGRALGIGSGGDYGVGAASALITHAGVAPMEALEFGIHEAIRRNGGCGGMVRSAITTRATEAGGPAPLPEIWPGILAEESIS